jgi:hypothetical protein
VFWTTSRQALAPADGANGTSSVPRPQSSPETPCWIPGDVRRPSPVLPRPRGEERGEVPQLRGSAASGWSSLQQGNQLHPDGKFRGQRWYSRT